MNDKTVATSIPAPGMPANPAIFHNGLQNFTEKK
jgi:hypothetical protein